MTARPYLRTHDLALAGHISVQQVRNYEANGLIPQAQRSPSGYRLYTQQHLAALKAVKSMVRGYGWPRTSAIMQALHRGDLSALSGKKRSIFHLQHCPLACILLL